MATRRKRKRNKNWDFVRDTFRQIYLAKAFAAGPKESYNNNAHVDATGNGRISPKELSLSISEASKLKEESRHRRLRHLQDVVTQEAFICKTLGMDHLGMCIHHPNQYIYEIPQYESIFKTIKEKRGRFVKTCMICRSEACQASDRGAELLRHSPKMINVIKQVQNLQSDRKEWRKRTDILGMKSSHHNNEIRSNYKSMMRKRSNHSSDNTDNESETSGDEFCGDDNCGSLTPNDWVECARSRVLQVRSWEDRFAIKYHPVFCYYFKMFQFGVPLEAVKHNVSIDGYPTRIMDLNPNQSLELQLDQLDATALETLRFKGVINDAETNEKNHRETERNNLTNIASNIAGSEYPEFYLDDSNHNPPDQSVPDTMVMLVSAFSRRRSSQIFAAAALFDETKHGLEGRRDERLLASSDDNKNDSMETLFDTEIGRILKNQKNEPISDISTVGTGPSIGGIITSPLNPPVLQKEYSVGLHKNSQYKQRIAGYFDSSHGRHRHRGKSRGADSQRSLRTSNKSGHRRRDKQRSSKELDDSSGYNDHSRQKSSKGLGDHSHSFKQRSSRELDDISGYNNHSSHSGSRRLDGRSNHKRRHKEKSSTEFDNNSGHTSQRSFRVLDEKSDLKMRFSQRRRKQLDEKVANSERRIQRGLSDSDDKSGHKNCHSQRTTSERSSRAFAVALDSISDDKPQHNQKNTLSPGQDLDSVLGFTHRENQSTFGIATRSQEKETHDVEIPRVRSSTHEDDLSKLSNSTTDSSNGIDDPPIKEIVLFDSSIDHSFSKCRSVESELDELLKREPAANDTTRGKPDFAYDISLINYKGDHLTPVKRTKNERSTSRGQSARRKGIAPISRDSLADLEDYLMDALSVISERNKVIGDLRQQLTKKDRENNGLRRHIEELNRESSRRRQRSRRSRHHSKNASRQDLPKNEISATYGAEARGGVVLQQTNSTHETAFADESEIYEDKNRVSENVCSYRDISNFNTDSGERRLYSIAWGSNESNGIEPSVESDLRKSQSARPYKSRSTSDAVTGSRSYHDGRNTTKIELHRGYFAHTRERSSKQSPKKVHRNNSSKFEQPASSPGRRLERDDRNESRRTQHTDRSDYDGPRNTSRRSGRTAYSPDGRQKKESRNDSRRSRNTARSSERSVRNDSHRSGRTTRKEPGNSSRRSRYTTNSTEKRFRKHSNSTGHAAQRELRNSSRRSLHAASLSVNSFQIDSHRSSYMVQGEPEKDSRRSQHTINLVDNDNVNKEESNLTQGQGGGSQQDANDNPNYMDILSKCFEQVSKIEDNSQDQGKTRFDDGAEKRGVPLRSGHSTARHNKNSDRLGSEQHDKVKKSSDRQDKEDNCNGKERAQPRVESTPEKRRRRKKKSRKAKDDSTRVARGGEICVTTDRNSNESKPGDNAVRKKRQKDTETSHSGRDPKNRSVVPSDIETTDRVAHCALSESQYLFVDEGHSPDKIIFIGGSHRSDRRNGGNMTEERVERTAAKTAIANLLQDLIE